MLPILRIGPAAIQVDGLILLLGLWIGLTLSERYSMRRGIQPAHLYNLVFFMVIGGLIGARLSYLLRYPQAFLNNPVSLISPNPGLFDFWGGVLLAILTALWYLQRKHIALLAAMDSLTPLFAVLMIAVPVSNLASGTGYGMPASIPWGINLWGAQRHPAQLYEAVVGSLILVVLWPGKYPFDRRSAGEFFLQFLTYSAASVLFLEYFRGDSSLWSGGIRVKQVAAWAILAFCLWFLGKIRNLRQKGSAD